MLKTLGATIIVAVCALLVACDGTGPADSFFTVTITGDTTFSFEGEALYGISSTSGHDQWVFFLNRGLFGGLDFDAIMIGRNESVTPIGVGLHQIEDATSDPTDGEDIETAYIISRPDGSIGSFLSVSGTLTISNATGEQIQGDFSFSAEFALAVGSFGEVRNLTIAGSFTAIPGNIPSIVP